MAQLPFTPAAKRALERSLREAPNLRNKTAVREAIGPGAGTEDPPAASES